VSLLRTVRACLARDLALAASYRFDLLLQAIAVGLFLAVLFFVATLVRSAESVDAFGGYFPFAVVGVVTAGVLDATFSGVAQALRSEQALGTLEESLLAAPRAADLVVGGAAATVVRAFLVALLYVGGATVAHGPFLHGSAGLAALVLLLAIAASAALGLLSASFYVRFKRGDPVQFLVRGAALLLSGVLFPTSALPKSLAGVGQILPVTWALDATRDVLLRGASLHDVARPLLLLAGFVALALPIGLVALQRSLARARRDGTLGHF
jgi:ABC-2 type transport system permease protein